MDYKSRRSVCAMDMTGCMQRPANSTTLTRSVQEGRGESAGSPPRQCTTLDSRKGGSEEGWILKQA